MSSNSSPSSPSSTSVCIIGAGAAGMACAWSLSLSKSPQQKYNITIIDPFTNTGGMAQTLHHTTKQQQGNKDKGEDITMPPINYGVQGGASSYRNIMMFHDAVCGGDGGTKNTKNTKSSSSSSSLARSNAPLQVSFGKGQYNWTNSLKRPTNDFLKKMQPEIERFGTVLKWLYRIPISTILPIEPTLRLLGFSKEFVSRMVIPLVALFFGTGNMTASVSSMLIAAVFNDAKLRLFDYDKERLLAGSPDMFAFGPLDEIYQKESEAILSANPEKNRILTNSRVTKVEKVPGGGGWVSWESSTETNPDNSPVSMNFESTTKHRELFDKVVFACNAETVLKLLQKDQTTLLEKLICGNIYYLDDVTYTHTDDEYMKKHYDLVSSSSEKENSDIMYFIESDEKDPRRVTMSFALDAYQSHIGRRIWQTIFLDERRKSREWSHEEIDKEKILAVTPWRQMPHVWSNFLTVPLMPLIQGGNNDSFFFCGVWTMATNTHEIATLTGFAVAERIGARYPFRDSGDKLATHQFWLVNLIQHGVFVTYGWQKWRQVFYYSLLVIILIFDWKLFF